MKKIFLTLIAVAAFVIACDKDAYDQEITNINVLEQAEEINATVENGAVSSETGDILIDYILDNMSDLRTSKKGQENLTNKGDDYVNVVVFSEGGFTYLGLFDDSNDDVCFNGKVITQFFWDNSAGDGSVLSIEDTSGNVVRTVGGNFATFFSEGLNSITQLTLTPTSLTINDSADLNDINVATAGIEHNFVCAEGKYRITDAPFPLNGKLGTIINQAMFKGTARNFAGTLEADVIREIEAEIVNGIDNVNQ